MKKRIAVGAVIFAAILFAGNLFLRAIYVVPIAMYHSIDMTTNKTNRLIVAPEIFKRQMEFLKRNRYNVISLKELADILNSKRRLPRKTICITLDDGYENNYKYAYPVLNNLKLPATIFIMTDAIDKAGYLTAGEIKEMAKGVIDIGSHTKTHFWLGETKAIVRAREEIVNSKQVLENIISKNVTFFCYPGGGFTKETRQLVIDAGYRGAVATNPGHRYPKHDVYALKRLRISSNCANLFIFWVETSGYYTWIKEHRDKD